MLLSEMTVWTTTRTQHEDDMSSGHNDVDDDVTARMPVMIKMRLAVGAAKFFMVGMMMGDHPKVGLGIGSSCGSPRRSRRRSSRRREVEEEVGVGVGVGVTSQADFNRL